MPLYMNTGSVYTNGVLFFICFAYCLILMLIDNIKVQYLG